MSLQQVRVTVAITTFDEEENISECLKSIIDCGFDSIRVYDGGSTDQTRAIVEGEFPSVFFSSTALSLSARRKLAIEECTSEFIFFVDADQRLLRYDYIKIIEETFNHQVAGIQFLKVLPDTSNTSYWQRGFAIRNRIIQGKNPVKKVIGTPCIYKSELLQKFNYSDNIEGAADDTLVGHLLNQNDYYFVAIDERAIEIFRPSAKGTARKAFWYGLGDAEFVSRTRENKARINHLFHVFCRNPIIYPLSSLKFAPYYFPFLIFFGIARVAGFLVGLINSKVQLTKT